MHANNICGVFKISTQQATPMIMKRLKNKNKTQKGRKKEKEKLNMDYMGRVATPHIWEEED